MVNKFGKKAHDQMKSKLQTTEFFSIQILDGAWIDLVFLTLGLDL